MTSNRSKLPVGYLQKVSKKIELGKVVYRLYHQPKGSLDKTLQRGIVNSFVDARAKKEMEAAAYSLAPVKTDPPCYDIHFLTGARFWYQTVFCAYSMTLHSDISLRPIIYDDGSLLPKFQKEIKRIFPNAQIHLKSELDEKVEAHLPVRKFPYLRERRENYPNIRKLIDIHINSRGWKLVLDSDMLFFSRPNCLIDWLKNPTLPCHMVDVDTFYGYSMDLMKSLTGHRLAERINVGICGLNSAELNWEQLEHWCRTLIEEEKTHYFQEQALVAMLMAGRNCDVAEASSYKVMPDKDEVLNPKAVLHHYVSDSKPWYFRHAWKSLAQKNSINT